MADIHAELLKLIGPVGSIKISPTDTCTILGTYIHPASIECAAMDSLAGAIGKELREPVRYQHHPGRADSWRIWWSTTDRNYIFDAPTRAEALLKAWQQVKEFRT